ncbi:MAG: chorismate mutase [Tissierellaceae bacterium]|jgi:monofunctional chorismate mutase|nr:chorismate mutase [Tissierellia bacterium]
MDDLKVYRDKIDKIDAELVALFEERMEIVLKIAAYKKANKLPVYNASREKEVIARNTSRLKNQDFAESLEKFLLYMMDLSKEEQRKRL